MSRRYRNQCIRRVVEPTRYTTPPPEGTTTSRWEIHSRSLSDRSRRRLLDRLRASLGELHRHRLVGMAENPLADDPAGAHQGAARARRQPAPRPLLRAGLPAGLLVEHAADITQAQPRRSHAACTDQPTHGQGAGRRSCRGDVQLPRCARPKPQTIWKIYPEAVDRVRLAGTWAQAEAADRAEKPEPLDFMARTISARVRIGVRWATSVAPRWRRRKAPGHNTDEIVDQES